MGSSLEMTKGDELLQTGRRVGRWDMSRALRRRRWRCCRCEPPEISDSCTVPLKLFSIVNDHGAVAVLAGFILVINAGQPLISSGASGDASWGHDGTGGEHFRPWDVSGEVPDVVVCGS